MTFEFILFILYVISLFIDWRKYRKDIEKASDVNEIRPIFVRFLLSSIVFILFLIIVIF